jgi:hypothetical protein
VFPAPAATGSRTCGRILKKPERDVRRERFRKKTHFFVTWLEIAVTIDEVIKSLLSSIYSRISLICVILSDEEKTGLGGIVK